MIAYYDTSAIVPLLVEEPGTDAARVVWDEAIRTVTVAIAYAEARAAVAQARRIGRLTPAQARVAVDRLDAVYSQLDLVVIDDGLVRTAGALADAHGLRGYDAVHLAAAQALVDDDVVLVAGDRALLRGAEALGLAVAPIG